MVDTVALRIVRSPGPFFDEGREDGCGGGREAGVVVDVVTGEEDDIGLRGEGGAHDSLEVGGGHACAEVGIGKERELEAVEFEGKVADGHGVRGCAEIPGFDEGRVGTGSGNGGGAAGECAVHDESAAPVAHVSRVLRGARECAADPPEQQQWDDCRGHAEADRQRGCPRACEGAVGECTGEDPAGEAECLDGVRGHLDCGVLRGTWGGVAGGGGVVEPPPGEGEGGPDGEDDEDEPAGHGTSGTAGRGGGSSGGAGVQKHKRRGGWPRRLEVNW